MPPERIDRANSLSARNFPLPSGELFCGRYRIWPRIFAVFLLALIVVPAGAAWAAQVAPQSSTNPVCDSQSFVKELGRLKDNLGTTRSSTETIRAYRESLPEAWNVDAGGQRYNVPSDLLASQLEKAEKQPELRRQQLNQARDYLDSLAAETASLSGLPAPSTDSARSKLQAILSRSEYTHTQKESRWDKFRTRIDELLDNALGSILRGIGGQGSLGYALLWIGICASAIFIATMIFRRWVRSARGEEMALQAAAIPLRSWQEWVFASRDAAAHGDYRFAIHCAYWAGIARLQDLGAISPDRARTPREYLRAHGKATRIAPETLAARQQALSMLTSRLEKTWYGYQIAGEADFRDSLAELETLGCHLP